MVAVAAAACCLYCAASRPHSATNRKAKLASVLTEDVRPFARIDFRGFIHLYLDEETSEPPVLLLLFSCCCCCCFACLFAICMLQPSVLCETGRRVPTPCYVH